MKIELRNIKHFPAMSQETNCFTARIYLEAVYVADISNQGTGGSDMIHAREGQRDLLNKLEEWCKLQPPKMVGDLTIPSDLETYCDDLLFDHLTRQDMLKAMKRKVLVRTPEGKIMEYSWKGVKRISQKHIQTIRDKNPDAIVLNILPVDAALEYYKAVSL
jgi:hypothetical protein